MITEPAKAGWLGMKAGYVLLDGCGDRPNPALNYTTPLEAAYTPNMDATARRSRLGNVVTVKKGIAPESDIAVFNMLGYSFDRGYPGRGVVEAVGSGLEVHPGDLALRANFASVKGRRIVDRRAGRDLTQEEAEALAEDISGIELGGADFDFRATVSYRGVLVIRASGGLSADVTNTDPAYAKIGGFGAAKKTTAGESVLSCRPESRSETARRSAALVNEFTAKSIGALSRSGVNESRVKDGRLPANCVLLRDPGDHLPDVPSFSQMYGMNGTALVEMPAEVGIARLIGMKMVKVRDRHDLKEKARLFSSELKDGTVVYVHLKGPDEFGHDGDAVGKKRSIESIDREFFSEVVAKLEGTTVGVSCDHATPCTIKMHSADPVPLMVTTRGKGDSMRFTEANSSKGSMGLMMGRDVLRSVLSGTGQRN